MRPKHLCNRTSAEKILYEYDLRTQRGTNLQLLAPAEAGNPGFVFNEPLAVEESMGSVIVRGRIILGVFRSLVVRRRRLAFSELHICHYARLAKVESS